MQAIIPLLIILLVAVIAIWLIRQIPFPAGLQVIQTILVAIVVILALVKVLAYL